MRCGISTACFFPNDTLESLKKVAQTGAPVTELFLNTFSELEDGYVARLQETVQNNHLAVASVHPFSSAMEGFFFTSHYHARFADGMRLYRRFCEICNIVGANKLVFHGDHRSNPAALPLADYAVRFRTLAEMALEYDVTLCHENVFYCRLGDPAVVAVARSLFGKFAAFVLDTKQVVRSGAGLDEMLDAMGDAVRHVHISDYTPSADCLPPGTGQMDTPAFINKLKAIGFEGDLIIELYREGFATPEQLVQAMAYLQNLANSSSHS